MCTARIEFDVTVGWLQIKVICKEFVATPRTIVFTRALQQHGPLLLHQFVVLQYVQLTPCK